MVRIAPCPFVLLSIAAPALPATDRASAWPRRRSSSSRSAGGAACLTTSARRETSTPRLANLCESPSSISTLVSQELALCLSGLTSSCRLCAVVCCAAVFQLMYCLMAFPVNFYAVDFFLPGMHPTWKKALFLIQMLCVGIVWSVYGFTSMHTRVGGACVRCQLAAFPRTRISLERGLTTGSSCAMPCRGQSVPRRGPAARDPAVCDRVRAPRDVAARAPAAATLGHAAQRARGLGQPRICSFLARGKRAQRSGQRQRQPQHQRGSGRRLAVGRGGRRRQRRRRPRGRGVAGLAWGRCCGQAQRCVCCCSRSVLINSLIHDFVCAASWLAYILPYNEGRSFASLPSSTRVCLVN